MANRVSVRVQLVLTGLRKALFTLLSLYVAFPFWHNAVCPSAQTETYLHLSAKGQNGDESGRTINHDSSELQYGHGQNPNESYKVTFVIKKYCSAAEVPWPTNLVLQM